MHCLRIVSAIRYYYKEQGKIFILQGGIKQGFINFPAQTKIFNLPHPFYSRLNLKQAVKLNEGQIKSRIEFMLKRVKEIKPDIFITEFFPFGRTDCQYELLPILKLLREKGVKIYSSIPMPYFVHNKEMIRQLLSFCALYDKILIHTPRNLDLQYMADSIHFEKRISRKAFLSVFSYLHYKIEFTGYVMPFGDRKKSIAKDRDYILVQRGGGTVLPKLINCSILAAKFLDTKCKMQVIAGPATTKNEASNFRHSLRNTETRNIKLKKYVPDLFNYIQNCNLCITTAGGTIYELLYLRKKAIVVPFMGYPGKERADQFSRAQILKDYLGATVLDYKRISPQMIAKEINKKLSLPDNTPELKKIDSDWFDGAKVTASLIMRPC